MSRPIKNTVDWIPHFTDCMTSDSMQIIQAQFGNDGYAVWWKMLETLGRSDNHKIDCSNPTRWKLLVASFQVDEAKATAILNEFALNDCIDAELWKTKVIWATNLVDNVQGAYTNRRREAPARPDPATPEKTKRKQAKEESKKVYGKFDNVKLTDKEFASLKEEFPDHLAKIDNLSTYKKSQGKSYKDDYATILSWNLSDKKKQEGANDKRDGKSGSNTEQSRADKIAASIGKPVNR